MPKLNKSLNRTIISDNKSSTEDSESESDDEAVVGGTSDEDKLDNHSVAHRLVPGTNLTLAEFEFEQDGIYIDKPMDADMIDSKCITPIFNFIANYYMYS